MCCFTPDLWAGGSGLNVVVVVNQNSANSVQLGNYYRQLRQVPPQNYLRINWTGTNTEWALTDFNNTLLNPFLAMLASNQLTNQIDYVVLSMDIPYRIVNGTNGYNSTTSALFYGFKNDPDYNYPCEITDGSTNLYAGSESIFRQTPPISSSSNYFLVTMITANDLPTAEMVVSQGTISDGTFPSQTVWLGMSADSDRNGRLASFDNPVFNTRLRGNYSVMRTNMQSLANSAVSFTSQILGYENGWGAPFSISPIPLFVPGAMADNLTSFGGRLFDSNDQPVLFNFLGAGASGSYGTVIEPCAYLEKFPDPQIYFYQSRGFSLAECYYQSLTNGYQGLVAGEPLAAPFAQPGSGAWNGLGSNTIVSGTTNLSVQFTASDALHPLQQVDFFLDGNWLQTVTNIPPQSGNVLHVTLNGYATSYSVPAGATIKSVASNLVTVLNGIAYQNLTEVSATAHGDRIQLESTAAPTRTGGQISLSTSATASSGPLTTFIHASATNPTNFLDTIAYGFKQYVIEETGTLNVGNVLKLTVTKTNNVIVTVSVTNTNSAATLGQFTQQLIDAVTNDVSLQGSDGLTAGNLLDAGNEVAFVLFVNGQGYAAAQIKANLTGPADMLFSANGTFTISDNQDDLPPRNHLYITAGATNLPVTIPFKTTNFSDGYHELIAVAYEGSHVHTQTRATQDIIIKNTSLTASFSALVGGTNSSLQPSLQFTVTASPTNISTIQLFGTGGLLAAVSNLSTATFSINLTNLGIGSHPFYAIVTDKSGHQYRTATQTVGLIGVNYAGTSLIGLDYPFPVQISGAAPILVWPATAGRSYNILSTSSLGSAFQLRAIVTPTNSLGQWTETNTSPAQQFYRVSVSP